MICLDFVRQGREQSGFLPVTKLLRLHDQLGSTDGQLEYRIIGDYDPLRQNQPRLLLDLQGNLTLKCVHCLGPVVWSVRLHNALYLACNGEDLARLDEEVVDAMSGQEPFDVVSLIEDELLLSIPYIVAHEGSCFSSEEAMPVQSDLSSREDGTNGVNSILQKQRTNPFGVLEPLRTKRKESQGDN